MSLNDYVKYLTEQFIKVISRPSKESSISEKQQMGKVYSYSNHWFGLFPFSLKLFKREKPEL